MYRFCLPELDKLGVPSGRLRREVFGPPKDVTQEPGWPEAVTGRTAFRIAIRDGKTITALAGEPIMVSLERSGIMIPNSCRSGECSLCRTKLLSGEVFQLPGARVRKSDRRFGYIHPCLAYPLGDLDILI